MYLATQAVVDRGVETVGRLTSAAAVSTVAAKVLRLPPGATERSRVARALLVERAAVAAVPALEIRYQVAADSAHQAEAGDTSRSYNLQKE